MLVGDYESRRQELVDILVSTIRERQEFSHLTDGQVSGLIQQVISACLFLADEDPSAGLSGDDPRLDPVDLYHLLSFLGP